MLVCRAVLTVKANVRPPPESTSVGTHVAGAVSIGRLPYNSSKLAFALIHDPRSVSPLLSFAVEPTLMTC